MTIHHWMFPFTLTSSNETAQSRLSMRALPLLGCCVLMMSGCGEGGGGVGEIVAADQFATDAGCPLYVPLNGTTSITLDGTKSAPLVVNERSLLITNQA